MGEEEQVEAVLAANDQLQAELLRKLTRAVATPRPDLVQVAHGDELSDQEFNQEVLAANGDRLLTYLRNIQNALEARVWFSRPAVDAKTAVGKERQERLAVLGEFCLEVADAAEEALVKDLNLLGYRDGQNRFGLKKADDKKHFWR